MIQGVLASSPAIWRFDRTRRGRVDVVKDVHPALVAAVATSTTVALAAMAVFSIVTKVRNVALATRTLSTIARLAARQVGVPMGTAIRTAM